MASHPELANVSNLPTTFSAPASDQIWDRHLYVDENGKYPAKLNGWEALVIRHELDQDDVVGWFRNPPRKEWSVCVPYEKGGITFPMYPDFLMFRKTDSGIVVDILDPHAESLADAVAKARGLAKFAEHHLLDFGRIELISVKNDEARRLNLAVDETRSDVLGITTPSQLSKLFESAGKAD